MSPTLASSASSWIQLDPNLPGMPTFLPARSAAVAIPLLAFENTTFGNWAKTVKT